MDINGFDVTLCNCTADNDCEYCMGSSSDPEDLGCPPELNLRDMPAELEYDSETGTYGNVPLTAEEEAEMAALFNLRGNGIASPSQCSVCGDVDCTRGCDDIPF